jgi:hypothetical protein
VHRTGVVHTIAHFVPRRLLVHIGAYAHAFSSMYESLHVTFTLRQRLRQCVLPTATEFMCFRRLLHRRCRGEEKGRNSVWFYCEDCSCLRDTARVVFSLTSTLCGWCSTLSTFIIASVCRIRQHVVSLRRVRVLHSQLYARRCRYAPTLRARFSRALLAAPSTSCRRDRYTRDGAATRLL